LPVPQEQLLEALGATGKPLIVILTSGSALAVNWANQHAAAILEAWYPGEEGGNAVADVLSGDYNPSGRLPVTFYNSVAQLPPFTDYSTYSRTYRYLGEAPLFPFGFGLSYSTFSYSDPAVAGNGASSDSSGNTTITAKVTNTSNIAGDEVAELYVVHPGIDGAPIRSLEGFQRVHLAPNASQTVTFTLTPRELSVVDAEGNRTVPAGPVEVWVGSSQPIPMPNHPSNAKSAHFTITQPTPVPN
jgi:beta-glucosidase